MNKTQEWLFTFGYGQAYPNKFVRIKGSKLESRMEMFKRYGDKWSFQYSAEDEEKLLQYHITELKQGQKI